MAFQRLTHFGLSVYPRNNLRRRNIVKLTHEVITRPVRRPFDPSGGVVNHYRNNNVTY